jgi:hypothetical protein
VGSVVVRFEMKEDRDRTHVGPDARDAAAVLQGLLVSLQRRQVRVNLRVRRQRAISVAYVFQRPWPGRDWYGLHRLAVCSVLSNARRQAAGRPGAMITE